MLTAALVLVLTASALWLIVAAVRSDSLRVQRTAVMNMDTRVGNAFEAGLASLKTLTETR